MRKQTVDAQKDLDDRKTEFQDCVQQARDLEDDILVSTLQPYSVQCNYEKLQTTNFSLICCNLTYSHESYPHNMRFFFMLFS